MRHTVLGLVLLAVLPAAARADVVLGTNAIVNGDAETGNIAGWSGDFVTVGWDTPGGFPTSTTPGPPDRGKYFFAGGPSTAYASGTQFVSVSNLASQVDAGNLSFDLSGYLGGFSSQRDNTTLTVSFLGAGGTSLGSAEIGPVTPAQRDNETALLLVQTGGAIPEGTRGLEFLIQMTRLDGSYDDGYADNLSFVAMAGTQPPPPPPPPTVTPEPSALVLLATGLCGGAELLRRRFR